MACIVHRGTVLRRIKPWAEREVTLDVALRSPAVGAADIPLCLFNMADIIRTPTPCLSLCLPLTAGLPFLDSRRIELHGQPSNLQSYARAKARRTESYPLHPSAAAAEAEACAQIRDRR